MGSDIFDMTDKTAVIVGAGANGGIGHVIALAFAAHGADIVAADIDEPGAIATKNEIEKLGRRSIAVHCDASKELDVIKLFEQTDQAFGKVDVLVNLPFWFPRMRPHELDLEGWERTLMICLTSYFLCSKQAIQRMLTQETRGTILNIGSIAGVTALGRGNFAYSVSKGGVHQMTRELAIEYGREGIRVNAILPCQVSTPGLKKQLIADPQMAMRVIPRFVAGIPLGRLLEPEEFAGPALLLCSKAGSGMTGVLMPVDGGNLAMNATGSLEFPNQ